MSSVRYIHFQGDEVFGSIAWGKVIQQVGCEIRILANPTVHGRVKAIKHIYHPLRVKLFQQIAIQNLQCS